MSKAMNVEPWNMTLGALKVLGIRHSGNSVQAFSVQ